MNLRRKLILPGVALMLTFSAPAFSQEGGKERGKGKPGWMKGGGKAKMMKHLESLGLTDEQRTKIKELHEAHRAEMEAQRTAMRAAQKAFHDAVSDSDKTDQDLTAMHEALVNAHADRMRTQFKHLLQIRAVLTPEQRAKFKGAMRGGPED